MNFTGVTELHYLSNDYFDILLIGDNHTMYDPFADNVMHNWIDMNITKAANSYVLTEHFYINAQICFPMHLMPRYFAASRVYYCDGIRYTFDHETPNKHELIHAAEFVEKCFKQPVILQLLELPKINLSDSTNHQPYYDYFAKKMQEIIHDNSHLYNQDYIPFSEIAKNNKNVKRNMYFKYELIMMHYLRTSFIYQVVNWIKTYYEGNDLPADELLWDMVSSWGNSRRLFAMWTFHPVNTRLHLLDMVMILKLLNLRKKTSKTNKLLFWIPAGNAHTMEIGNFLKKLFAFMKYTGVEKYIKADDLNASDEMLKLATEVPGLGLRPPSNQVNKLYISSEELLKLADNNIPNLVNTVLDDKFIAAYPACTNFIDDIKQRLMQLDNISQVVKILELIQDKQIVKFYLPAELDNLLAVKDFFAVGKIPQMFHNIVEDSRFKSIIADTGSKYNDPSYLMFTDAFKSIFIPWFTSADLQTIRRKYMNIEKYMNSPYNLQFDKLRVGKSALQIKTNANWYKDSTNLQIHVDISNMNVYKYNENFDLYIEVAKELADSDSEPVQIEATKILESYRKEPAELKDKLIHSNILNFTIPFVPVKYNSDSEQSDSEQSDSETSDPPINYRQELKNNLKVKITQGFNNLQIENTRKLWDEHLNTFMAKFVNVDKALLNLIYQATITEFYSNPIIGTVLDKNYKEHLEMTFIYYLDTLYVKYLKNKYKDIIDNINYKNKPFMRHIVNVYLEKYNPPDLLGLYNRGLEKVIKAVSHTDDDLLSELTQTMLAIVDANKYQLTTCKYYIREILGDDKYADAVNYQFVDEDHLLFEVTRLIDLASKNVSTDGVYNWGTFTLIKGGGDGNLLNYILLAILVILVMYIVYIVFKQTFVSKRYTYGLSRGKCAKFNTLQT